MGPDPLIFQVCSPLDSLWSISLCKITQLQESQMRPTVWTLSHEVFFTHWEGLKQKEIAFFVTDFTSFHFFSVILKTTIYLLHFDFHLFYFIIRRSSKSAPEYSLLKEKPTTINKKFSPPQTWSKKTYFLEIFVVFQQYTRPIYLDLFLNLAYFITLNYSYRRVK